MLFLVFLGLIVVTDLLGWRAGTGREVVTPHEVIDLSPEPPGHVLGAVLSGPKLRYRNFGSRATPAQVSAGTSAPRRANSCLHRSTRRSASTTSSKLTSLDGLASPASCACWAVSPRSASQDHHRRADSRFRLEVDQQDHRLCAPGRQPDQRQLLLQLRPAIRQLRQKLSVGGGQFDGSPTGFRGLGRLSRTASGLPSCCNMGCSRPASCHPSQSGRCGT
jgi:hypothetical protein